MTEKILREVLNMGLLGNILSNAVSDGIGKGIQDAVGKAVESAVRPAADKLAGQAANQLNQATQELADSAEAAKDAATDAAASVPAPSGEGAASLGAALSGWASTMQGVAGQVAQNMKECPQCGELVTADHKFCPSCGAQLPEKTVGEGYVCPKCGKQNVPGTTYCAECGTLLPAIEEKRTAQSARWDELLPQYPRWTLGGDIEYDTDGELNGQPTVGVRIGELPSAQLGAKLAEYVGSLKADGFIPAYDGDSDFYYKMVDGVCRAFDKTDANQGDFLSMTFFVGDFDKRAAEKEKQKDAAADTAKDAAKAAADAAKGLFKKFF